MVITIDGGMQHQDTRAAMKFRLKRNSTRTIYPISNEPAYGRVEIIATRAACRVSRIFSPSPYPLSLSFCLFFATARSPSASDNPSVNNEPLNPSVGEVMTIIGDFQRARMICARSIVYRAAIAPRLDHKICSR